MRKNKIERKDIVKIDNKEVVLESLKDFNEFRKHYNKYDFMQKKQINTWETKLKGPTDDPVPEPTIRDVVGMVKELANVVNNLTLEVREGFRRNDERWEKQEEFNKKQIEFNKMVLNVFKLNNLKTN